MTIKWHGLKSTFYCFSPYTFLIPVLYPQKTVAMFYFNPVHQILLITETYLRKNCNYRALNSAFGILTCPSKNMAFTCCHKWLCFFAWNFEDSFKRFLKNSKFDKARCIQQGLLLFNQAFIYWCNLIRLFYPATFGGF